MQPRILIIDQTHSILEEILSSNGIICDIFREYTREDVYRQIENYDGIVIRSKIKFDKEMLDKASHLKCIARSGSGMDAIDVEYASSKGIVCLSSPEGNRDAVGEHAMAMILSLFTKLLHSDHEVRHGLWEREKNRGCELKGKTVGIIGYGNMGRSFAQRLSGFECEVIAYDKYKTIYEDQYARKVNLETLFEQTDIFSIHLPLSQETHKMVDEAFLARFAKDIYVINTARGQILDTEGLVSCMQKKKVLGACLDVIEYESFTSEWQKGGVLPPELKYLFQAPNTVLSPHTGGLTQESAYKLSYVLASKIVDLFRRLSLI